jgi:hypothetical protein
MLSSVKNVFVDGTFKSVPKHFMQLYTLHGSYSGQVIPMAYAPLPDKKCNTYVRFFRLLQEFGIENEINFSQNIYKLILSVRKAVKIVFPNIKVTGCYFHFSQSHWRKIQELGLKSQYENDMLFKTQVKRITALPFLVLEDISGAWDKIYEKRIDDGINGPKNKYMQYVYNTWIKETVLLAVKYGINLKTLISGQQMIWSDGIIFSIGVLGKFMLILKRYGILG